MHPNRLLTALAVATLAACSQAPEGTGADASGPTPIIAIDGSSTVYPVTEAVAEEYQIAQQGAVRVTVTGKMEVQRVELDPVRRARLDDSAARAAEISATDPGSMRPN